MQASARNHPTSPPTAHLLNTPPHQPCRRHNYTHDVVSIRLGGCLHKDDKDWTRRIGNERHLVRALGATWAAVHSVDCAYARPALW